MMSQDVSHQKYHFLVDLEAFLTNISFCRASHVMESNEFCRASHLEAPPNLPLTTWDKKMTNLVQVVVQNLMVKIEVEFSQFLPPRTYP